MLMTIATLRGSAVLLAAACSLTFLVHSAPAAAEEQTLRFKLVVRPLGTPAELPEIGGHKISANQYTGVAMFEDGRIAYKRFVELDDGTGDVGTFTGYSTYTFQAGDSLTLSYTGGWDAKGVTGKYQVISGTGEYVGATGTGEFKSVEAKWEEAILLDGSFKLTLAKK